MKPLDQVCSTDAYAPDHTAKVHNKFDTRRSIMEELRAFATALSFKISSHFRQMCYFIARAVRAERL